MTLYWNKKWPILPYNYLPIEGFQMIVDNLYCKVCFLIGLASYLPMTTMFCYIPNKVIIINLLL